MPTLYDVKPAFQARLRPLVGALAKAGVTANQVTLAAAVLSIATGALIGWMPNERWLFWLLPIALFLRMALNAIDGMLAREHGQASTLGMFLNELCDVVSDLALILPFALIGLFPAWGVIAFAFTAFLSEFAGVLGIPAGVGRRYDGPVGKSDRAAVLGILGAILGLGLSLPAFVNAAIFPLLAVLSLYTVFNRVRAALPQAAP